METNINSVIDKIQNNPVKAIELLDKEIARKTFENENLLKELENYENIIRGTEDQELISLLEEIKKPDANLNEITEKITKLKETNIDNMKTMLERDQKLIELLGNNI